MLRDYPEFEFLTADPHEDDEPFPDCLAELKRDINELVWKYMPGKTTLDEADAVARRIFDLIAYPPRVVKVKVA